MILPLNLFPVYKKDDFLFFQDKNNEENNELIIDASRIDLISAYMKKNNLKRISVNSVYFPITDLNFLKYFPFIHSISIVDDNHDISIINNLKELREIRVGSYSGTVDFDNFPQLEILNISWSNKLKNLKNSVNLKWLWLNFYKSNTLEEFSNLNKVTYLYLNKPSITSLKGINGMCSLKELVIDTANKLESLSGLNFSNKNLIDFDIYKAPKLIDYEDLKYLINLEKLRFTKTGDMNDIYILKSFPYLKSVILGIKIINGDLSFLEKIEVHKFLNFPHYNLKSQK